MSPVEISVTAAERTTYLTSPVPSSMTGSALSVKDVSRPVAALRYSNMLSGEAGLLDHSPESMCTIWIRG